MSRKKIYLLVELPVVTSARFKILLITYKGPVINYVTGWSDFKNFPKFFRPPYGGFAATQNFRAPIFGHFFKKGHFWKIFPNFQTPLRRPKFSDPSPLHHSTPPSHVVNDWSLKAKNRSFSAIMRSIQIHWVNNGGQQVKVFFMPRDFYERFHYRFHGSRIWTIFWDGFWIFARINARRG